LYIVYTFFEKYLLRKIIFWIWLSWLFFRHFLLFLPSNRSRAYCFGLSTHSLYCIRYGRTQQFSCSCPMYTTYWACVLALLPRDATQSAVVRLHVVRPSVCLSVYLSVSVISPRWCKIEPRLLLQTNRKSHTRFRLAPKSTTSDDLERPKRHCRRNKQNFRSLNSSRIKCAQSLVTVRVN